MRFLQALEESGHITSTNLKILSLYSEKWAVSSYYALLQTHIMAEYNLADAISEVFKLDRLYSFDSTDVDEEALDMISWSEAQEYECFTPYRDEDGTYQACVLNPLDEKLTQFLSQRLPRYRPLILDRRMLYRSLEEAYTLEKQIPTVLGLIE